MQITIHAIENNARSSNTAVLNGLRVEIIDAPELVGSEKQVAWATEIRKQSIATLANKALGAMLKGNGITYDADELDAAIARINSELMTVIAQRLEPITAARVWIDNRGMDAAQISRAK